MKEFFINLANDLMPEPEKVDHDEVVARRHARIKELGNAEWRIKQRKGATYEPTTYEIWMEAEGVSGT